jgi:glycerol-3-phosphate dehydrogenase
MTQQLYKRELVLAQAQSKTFDVTIIGGGATGAGIALLASQSGLSVLLIEKDDFVEHTSSKSTKLLHGGVRYLEQAFKKLDINMLLMVYRALKERSRVFALAPHLTSHIPILLPCNSFINWIYYRIGLFCYDLLATSKKTGKTTTISSEESKVKAPWLALENFFKTIRYYDGQFDDVRLALECIFTSFDNGGSILNYVEALGIEKGDEELNIISCKDTIINSHFNIKTKNIVNATGAFTNDVRVKLMKSSTPIIRLSRGTHLVVKQDKETSYGVIVPKTMDNRVLFVLPWKEKYLLIGTTDVEVTKHDQIVPNNDEIKFILEEVNKISNYTFTSKDITSIWAGLRPLVKTTSDKSSQVSRDFKIIEEDNSIFTIAGGKWTSFLEMADEMVLLVNNKLKRTFKKNVVPPLRGYSRSEKAKLDFVVSESQTDIKEYLQKRYNQSAHYVFSSRKNNDFSRICPGLPYTEEEVAYLLEYEAVVKLSDLIIRRLALPYVCITTSLTLLEPCAKILGKVQRKNLLEIQQEIQDCKKDIARLFSSSLKFK